MLSSVNDCRAPRERISDGDVASIARSIERYRTRWIANGWHKPAWLAKQARLAPKGRRRPRSLEGRGRRSGPRERRRSGSRGSRNGRLQRLSGALNNRSQTTCARLPIYPTPVMPLRGRWCRLCEGSPRERDTGDGHGD